MLTSSNKPALLFATIIGANETDPSAALQSHGEFAIRVGTPAAISLTSLPVVSRIVVWPELLFPHATTEPEEAAGTALLLSTADRHRSLDQSVFRICGGGVLVNCVCDDVRRVIAPACGSATSSRLNQPIGR